MLGSAVTMLHQHADNVTNINQGIQEAIFVCRITCCNIDKRYLNKCKIIKKIIIDFIHSVYLNYFMFC